MNWNYSLWPVSFASRVSLHSTHSPGNRRALPTRALSPCSVEASESSPVLCSSCKHNCINNNFKLLCPIAWLCSWLETDRTHPGSQRAMLSALLCRTLSTAAGQGGDDFLLWLFSSQPLVHMLVYANIAVTKVKLSFKSTKYSFLCLEVNRGLSNKSIFWEALSSVTY